MDNKLSTKDRLILVNQYEILARLSNDDGEIKRYENLRNVFVEGYTWGYDLAFEDLSEEMDESDCRFVLDVLQMYRKLYYSRERNEEAQKSIEERKVLFQGFDLNDPQEVKYLSFTRFLVEELGRFQEIKELIDSNKIEDYNSHGFGPSMKKLRLMIQKTHEIVEHRHRDQYSRDLNKDEILEILNVE